MYKSLLFVISLASSAKPQRLVLTMSHFADEKTEAQGGGDLLKARHCVSIAHESVPDVFKVHAWLSRARYHCLRSVSGNSELHITSLSFQLDSDVLVVRIKLFYITVACLPASGLWASLPMAAPQLPGSFPVFVPVLLEGYCLISKYFGIS